MPDLLKIIITPVALVIGALIGTWRNGLDPRRDVGLQRAAAQRFAAAAPRFPRLRQQRRHRPAPLLTRTGPDGECADVGACRHG